MTTKTISCPYCKYPVEIDVEFTKKNGRVFCGTCCKAFDVKLQDVPKKHFITEEETDDDYDGMGYF
jgi:uncharacterized Zn finger protein (UPF0148 family)